MDATICVTECKTSSERLEFLQFPWKLHLGNAHWVPALVRERKEFIDPQKNPFYQHADVALFLASRSGKPLGTIAAIIDHGHNQFHNEKLGFFGFFECVNEAGVAQLLLATACDWCRTRGAAAIRGPANFSANDEFGLLIEGFADYPRVLMPYNPPYYQDLIEACGFEKVMDLFAYKWDLNSVKRDMLESAPSKLIKANAQIRNHAGVIIRRVNLARFDEDVINLKNVYNEALCQNWGFVPMTDSEARFLAKRFRAFIDPDLFWIAEYRGKPIGISLCLPDIYQPLKLAQSTSASGLLPTSWTLIKLFWYWKIRHKVTWIHAAVFGVVKEWQGRGIAVRLYYEPLKAAVRKGYQQIDLSWILENNKNMNRDIINMDGERYKIYRVYQKSLNGPTDLQELFS